MTKRLRFIIFLSFLIIFFLAVPAIILYSLGYRIDLKEKKLVQTGAVFLKALPHSADVSVSPLAPEKILIGRKKSFERKTGLLQGSVFIKNLFPEKYNIKVKKEGYQLWEKNLEVFEGRVIEAKEIILVPENPGFILLAENLADFWVTPDNSRMILRNLDNDLTFYNIKKNTLIPILKYGDLKIKKIDFFDLTFSEDSKNVLLKIESGNKISFFVLSLEDETKKLIPLEPTGLGEIKEAFFNPSDSKKILFVKNIGDKNRLFWFDYIKKEEPTPILDGFLIYKIYNQGVVWLDKNGFVYRSDFLGKNLEILNSGNPFLLKPEAKYQIAGNYPKIFLIENETFYLFENEINNFKKVFENAKTFKISPDNKKLALANDYELWVLFLEKQENQPYKEQGEKIFISRFSEKIDNCFWFSNQYLMFNLSNKIKIAEIDDRDKINIADLSPHQFIGSVGLSEFQNPKIFYSQTNKKLYILSEKKFYASEKPLR